MEEVDKILIYALKQVGTEVPEEVDSVKQFSSELIVEAVVSCLRVIDPGLSNELPISLPPGMSARFRVGMSLAQACQDVGYKGEIGYQTFLYSSEPEIRTLLMFLVEKLPRECAAASDHPTGKSLVLQRAVAAAIKAQLAVPWLPLNCRLPLHTETQGPKVHLHFNAQSLSLPHSPPGTKKLKEVSDYQQNILPPVTAQPSHHASVVASILEQHTADLSAAQEWENEWNSQGLLSRLTPQDYQLRKRSRLHKRIEEQLRSAMQLSSENVSCSSSDLSELLQTFKGSAPNDHTLTKGTLFTHTQKLNFTPNVAAAPNPLPPGQPSDWDSQLQQEEVLHSLQQQFQQLCSDVDQLTAELKHRGVTNTQLFSSVTSAGSTNGSLPTSLAQALYTLGIVSLPW